MMPLHRLLPVLVLPHALALCAPPALAQVAPPPLLARPGAVPATHLKWTQDHAAALKQAQAESKDLLLFFTSSDWAPGGRKLEEEVFATPTFQQASANRLIPVLLDFPKENKQTDAVQKQNVELFQKFAVASFPTVILTDAQGFPYAQFGYVPGGPENFLRVVDDAKLRRTLRDANFTLAAHTVGSARAKLLDAGLEGLDNDELIIRHYGEVIGEMERIDAGGGWKAKWEKKLAALKQRKQFEETMRTLSDKAATQPADCATKLEQLAAQANLPGECRQQAMAAASRLYFTTLKDAAKAEKLFDAAIAIDPNSPLGCALKEIREKHFPKQ